MSNQYSLKIYPAGRGRDIYRNIEICGDNQDGFEPRIVKAKGSIEQYPDWDDDDFDDD